MRFNIKIKWFNYISLVFFIAIFLSITTISEAKETTMSTCKNLQKVKDIDDLLFQFYSNLDSQCLFAMPTQKLEKIWGIRVLDYIGASSDKVNDLNIESQERWENKEGLFVSKENFEQGIPAFHIRVTHKYVDKNKGWGGSAGKGQYPKFLPAPQIVNKHVDESDQKPRIHGSRPIIPKNTVYEKYSRYYWVNRSNSNEQPVLLLETNYLPDPIHIILYSQAKILNN